MRTILPERRPGWWDGVLIALLAGLMPAKPVFGVPAASDVQNLISKARAEGSVRVIVRLAVPSVRSEPELAIAAAGEALAARLAGSGSSLHRFRAVPLASLEADEAALRRLESSDVVSRVWEDLPLRAALAESGPLVGAPAAWISGYTGAGQTIAILDSGVDASHPFLAGRVVEEACFSTTSALSRVFRMQSYCPSGASVQFGRGAAAPCGDESICFHGTHVAGIAAGHGDGMSGVAPEANLIAVQVFSKWKDPDLCAPSPAPCSVAFLSDVAKALEYVYDLRDRYSIAAVNLSLAFPNVFESCYESPLAPLVELLRGARIATVAAAGNDGGDILVYPACIPGAISVGNTTKQDAIHPTSNRSPWLSLWAPGTDIVSSVPGGGFRAASGTSMSAPHVAGAWALLKQKLDIPAVDYVQFALQWYGQPIPQDGAYRTRRLNLEWALDPDTVRFQDGGFEAGPDGPWIQVRESSHPLLRSAAEPGLPLQPLDGSWLAQLGEAGARDRIEQTITFPPGRRFSLRFHEQIRSREPVCAAATFRILANGSELYSEPLCAATETGSWVEREVDITSSLCAANIVLEVDARSSSDPASVFLDELSLVESGPPDVIPRPDAPAGPTHPASGLPYNYGGRATQASWGEALEYFYQWGDGTFSGWRLDPYGIGPRVEKTWRAAGTYAVRVKARSTLYKTIQSEWSNPIDVTVSEFGGGADLTGFWKKVRQRCERAGGTGSCTLKLAFTVTNAGHEASGATRLGLYLLDRPENPQNPTFIKRVRVPPLEAGERWTFSRLFKIAPGYTVSWWFAGAIIDEEGAVWESDETNNAIVSDIIP